MRTAYSFFKPSYLQERLYEKLNDFSESHSVLGRLCALPVSFLDIGIETAKTPLGAIENVAITAINLVGMAFSEKFSFKDALASSQMAFILTLSTPVRIIYSPIKFCYQFFVILIDPSNVKPYHPMTKKV